MTTHPLALQVVELLERSQHRIVFAESCTAGLISATLGEIPGVSTVLAGSAVVYQVDTKIAWLDVAKATLDEHGAVSQLVSQQMATGLLDMTPHATIAASITGHLGPDAPVELDGVAWCTVATREGKRVYHTSRQLLLDFTAEDDNPSTGQHDMRLRRRTEAVRQVLLYCHEVLTA